jgi:predicted lipoprotein with Yx(FWY)xxD motif
MKRISVLLVAGALVLAVGCGDDDESGASQPAEQVEAAMEKEKDGAAMEKEKDGAAMEKDGEAMAARKGRTIRLDESEFGTMLFDGRRQAIYIFENDPRGKSVCYGECARAWPPVLTAGRPRAGDGVRKNLLGTVTRRNGKRQVTYAGKPLYFYAHEAPGEVRCHNVNLNGGFWWVVGPDGKRRP